MPRRFPLIDRLALAAARPAARPAATALETSGSLTLTAAADFADPIASADGTSEQIAAFTLDAYTGGVMFPTLRGVDWNGPVVVDIAGIEHDQTLPVHREHDATRPVGHATVDTTGGHVRASGSFSVDGEDAETVIKSGRRGFPWKASIGLADMRYERIAAAKSVTVNGRQFTGPLLVVRSSRLNEISFVTVAGDPQSSAAIAATAPPPGVSDMSFAAWVSSLGLDLATLNASAVAELQGRYDSLFGSAVATATPGTSDGLAANLTPAPATPAAADPAATVHAGAGTATASSSSSSSSATSGGLSSDTLTAMRSAAAAEEGRITAIREIGLRFDNPRLSGGQLLTAHAITEGWTVQQATLEASRLSRPASPAIHTTSHDARAGVETLQAALLLRAGRSPDTVLRSGAGGIAPGWMARPVNDPQRQRIMDNAQEFRDFSMVEMAAESLRANGHTVPSGRNRHAILQAGFSTHSISAVFSQSIGAIALMAYAEAGDFSQGWTSEADNPNLIETDRPRLIAAQDLTLHETDGEADHVSRDAKNEKVKVDRFSRQANVDEVHFINDQFGLLAETPRDFGRAAARLRPNMVAAVLLLNANLLATGRALFNTTDVSLISSAALTQANLQKARAALSKRKDGDASLNLQASHLVVPSDLGDLAVQLTRSAALSNDSGAGSTNPIFLRNITPIDEGRLANGVTNPWTGATIAGSLTSWYLIAADGHTIEVQYLAGTGRVPVITVEPLSGGKLGLCIVVKHYVGAKALDFRGMVRCDA